jgi:hypothetical protein
VLEPFGGDRRAGHRPHRLADAVDRVVVTCGLEQRKPDVVLLLEAHLHPLADVDVVRVAPDHVGREVDAGVLLERDVRDRVRRRERGGPLGLIDRERDHRAAP